MLQTPAKANLTGKLEPGGVLASSEQSGPLGNLTNAGFLKEPKSAVDCCHSEM